MDNQQLLLLGFSEKEALVYLALNEIGASPASTLAKKIKLKRTSMYDILNNLLRKNLITAFKQGQYTYYAIDDINKIFYHQRDKVTLAKTVIQQLKENQKNTQGVDVIYYKGREGYIEMYNDILIKTPPEAVAWMNLNTFYAPVNPVFEEEWTKKRINKKIAVRLLLQDSPASRKFQQEDEKLQRQSKIIPTQFPFNTSCILYENNVTFFDSSGGFTGIRINHREFYVMQKQIFEMNWQLLA